MEQYKLLTVTHKRVPLSELDRFFVARSADDAQCETRLRALKAHFGLSGLFYLQTCNRVVYFFSSSIDLDRDFEQSFWSWINPALAQTGPGSGEEVAQSFQGSGAIRHLHEIASSLDSMVIGEREILRQIRQAYERCRDLELTDDDLRLAFKFIIPAAKRIFTETRIAERPVSVVSLAARALRNVEWSAKRRLILIGAGQSMQLMAKFIRPMKFDQIAVFNRNVDKAEALAASLGGRAYALSELPSYRAGFDVLISCTGASDYIVHAPVYQQLLAGETHERLLIDLAVPADLHPDIPAQFPVRYIGMDQLREAAEQNKHFRQVEMEKARLLVDQFVEEFCHSWQLRQVERQFQHLPDQVRRIRERAVEEIFAGEIAAMDERDRATMDKVLDYLERKFSSLHISSALQAKSTQLREEGLTKGGRNPWRRVAR